VKLSLLIVAWIAAVAAWPASAADVDLDTDSSSPPSRKELRRSAGATIVVFNRPIVRLRATVLGMSPEDRAETASKRIRALLGGVGDHKVTIDQVAQGVALKINGQFAFAITRDDVERLGEIAEMAQAEDAARALARVIAEMQELRDPRAMLVAAGWAGVATLIWLAALWVLRHGIRFIERRALRYAEAAGERMRAAGTEVVAGDRVLHAIRVGLTTMLWAFALLLSYEWLGFLLSRFPFTRPWGEGLSSFLVDTLLGFLAAIADSVPGLTVAVVIFLLARMADGMARSFFDGVQTGRTHFTWIDRDTAPPTRRLATIAIWLFAIAMAYPYIPGAQTDAFKGLSVLLGLMVSVGASGIVGQAASGLILMYTRTFRPGEYVRVSDNEGTVIAMGLFTTRVRTGMGEELTLPNSMVLGTVTRNYSRSLGGAGYVLDTAVTIGYDAPWRQVHAMLIEAAHRTDGVMPDPTPMVFQTALSDFYVEYRLVCHAIPSAPRPRAVVLSMLHASIQDVFNEHGVQIMSPHYLGDPREAKVVPPDRWYMPPAEPPA